MGQYNVGDKTWWARCGRREVKIPCPVCFGKCFVTLILGNDDKVVLPCDYCGRGYEAPKGTVSEHEWIAQPELVTVTRVDTRVTLEGEEREYFFGHFRLEAEVLFDTEEAARVKCEEIAKQEEVNQSSRAEAVKKDKHKTFSWNAGYHIRNAKKLREEAERHDRLAQICKARDKSKGTT